MLSLEGGIENIRIGGKVLLMRISNYFLFNRDDDAPLKSERGHGFHFTFLCKLVRWTWAPYFALQCPSKASQSVRRDWR